MPNETRELSIVPQHHEIVTLTSTDLIQRRSIIKDVMAHVMEEGLHYGTIPGVDKPMLFKAGADLLCNTFRLAPRFVITRTDLGNGHREYEIVTNLTHTATEQFWGSGLGSCSTMEGKYRWRNAARTCPECRKDTIIKGKPEYGGGWLCFQRKGGCGAKFDGDDPFMSSQSTGKVENPDIYSEFNTVLKMAKKRSLADAVITATGAADMFSHADEDEEETHQLQREPARASQPVQSQEKSDPTPQPTLSMISERQIGYLMQTCKQFKVPEDVLVDYLGELGIASRKDIPRKDFDSILSWVKANKQTGAAA